MAVCAQNRRFGPTATCRVPLLGCGVDGSRSALANRCSSLHICMSPGPCWLAPLVMLVSFLSCPRSCSAGSPGSSRYCLFYFGQPWRVETDIGQPDGEGLLRIVKIYSLDLQDHGCSKRQRGGILLATTMRRRNTEYVWLARELFNWTLVMTWLKGVLTGEAGTDVMFA